MKSCLCNNVLIKNEKNPSIYAELFLSNTFEWQLLSLNLGNSNKFLDKSYLSTINFTGSNKGLNLIKISLFKTLLQESFICAVYILSLFFSINFSI